MFKDFKEFNEKIHPYYGRATFSKKMELFKYIEEKEQRLCDICKLNDHCQHNYDYECKEADQNV